MLAAAAGAAADAAASASAAAAAAAATATREAEGGGGHALERQLPASTLKSISDGKAVSYPAAKYMEGAQAAFAAPGRAGVKSKTKACVNCFLFNSKHKLAKKYSGELQRNMQAAIRKERLDAIAQQLVYGDAATMRERTGDQAYGTGSDSDIDRRKKDAAEKKCLDSPHSQQAACLKKAKAMEPGAWRRHGVVGRGVAWRGMHAGT